MLDGSPLPENVDAFLILFEHPLDEHDSHVLFEQWVFIEGIADNIGKPPGPKQILIEFLELALAIIERKLLVDWVGEFVELFIIGGIAFPFRFFDERVNDLLQQGGLKTKFHTHPLSSSLVSPHHTIRMRDANRLVWPA